ncbi:hypothetical protein Syun_015242 [Stephania yunnanensis]|uniref:F-box domain-containing protein n=1 Tax=Stephania yunnanensis TaxID=152371 RepID=A0AAP0JKY5_9MAGN
MSQKLQLALAFDRLNPHFGFTIIAVDLRCVEANNMVFFEVYYSSKTKEWRSPKNGSVSMVPPGFRSRQCPSVFTGRNKVYWSFVKHVMWFDVDKEDKQTETMEEETEKVACFGLQSKLTEDIIFEEILPRLPIKSIFRFKLVSQKWLNFITHDPLLPTHHSQKGPNTTNDITSSGLFCPRSQLFFSSDDHNHQFKWNKPEFMTGQPDEVLGCCNGLTYGMLPGYLKIFIFNPITKHTVYAPNLLNHSLGFTILAIHNDKRKFKLYSSKTGEWRVFGDDPWYPLPRYHQAQVLNLGFVE